MTEPVDAAVALIARACFLTDLPRLARPPNIDRRRDAGDEAVGEPGAAAGVVAARKRVLQVGKRRGRGRARTSARRCASPRGSSRGRSRPPAGRHSRSQQRPASGRHGPRRPAENARVRHVCARLGEETAAGVEVDRRDGLVAAVPREQDGCDCDEQPPRRARRRGGDGRPAVAGRPWLRSRALLLDQELRLPGRHVPLDVLRLHLNVVVVETTNDSPGSRGPSSPTARPWTTTPDPTRPSCSGSRTARSPTGTSS